MVWRAITDLIHPDIFAAGLALTGFVIIRQVKRILALGRYDEHRSDPRSSVARISRRNHGLTGFERIARWSHAQRSAALT